MIGSSAACEHYELRGVVLSELGEVDPHLDDCAACKALRTRHRALRRCSSGIQRACIKSDLCRITKHRCARPFIARVGVEIVIIAFCQALCLNAGNSMLVAKLFYLLGGSCLRRERIDVGVE